MAEIRWTDEQARVLLETGNVLLSANAGTGKTATIVGKLAWLLGLDVGCRADGRPVRGCSDPCGLEEIAAITFTEKAACELKERLRATIEASDRAGELRWELDRAAVGTIHGFCAGLLRDHALRLGIDPTFRVLDERESTLRLQEIIRGEVMDAVGRDDGDVERLLERYGLYGSQYSQGLIGAVSAVVREVRWHRERYEAWLTTAAAGTPAGAAPRVLDLEKLAGIASDRLGGAAGHATDAEALQLAGALYNLARRVVHAWLDWMEDENVRDFDSLILDVRRLLTQPAHRPALESIRTSLRILVIDEFQDTDAAQRDIAFALAGLDDPGAPDLPQLLLVGDPKQSIYGFRGADVGVWNEVRRRMRASGSALALTENFRTQPGLIDFVNRACAAAIETAGEALEPLDPDLCIPYSPLTAFRPAGAGQGLDWLDCSVDGPVADERELEARLVASRVRGLLAAGRVADPRAPDGQRPVRRSDIAILARTRKALERVGQTLQEAGVPVYNAASLGLADRQEVLDLVTVLRLLADPRDDYHACAFLRSPFVGLRDEVIARFRLDPDQPGGGLLRQAAAWLRRVEAGEATWFEAPEHRGVAAIEREALSRALAALEEGQALVDRADASELLEEVTRRTGYRLHLLLRPGAEEALAAMERFMALLDEYRGLPLGTFLDLWDRWGEQDLGIPQAPLYSAADDVVTLQTIHTAKGLEWPVVILVGAGDRDRDRLSDTYLTDPELGPVLMPGKSERGPRAERIAARALAAERAEEGRLLYVALTRARDRLILAAPDVERGYMEFMAGMLREATLPHLVPDEPPRPPRRPLRARADDPVTRTGSQIEVFSDEDGGQLDIFRHGPPPAAEGDEAEADLPIHPVVYRSPDPEQATIQRIPVALDWVEGLITAELPELARPVVVSRERILTSATELQMREADPGAWRLRYVHGVEETWRFAPGESRADAIPAALRGTLIHGVLERIEAVEELSRLLGETIASVDAPPGVEELLEPGMPYRRALEDEIERVVTGDRWGWYVEGTHFRELPFLVLTGDRPWMTGALDLYRPGHDPWIIDFKTHRIAAEDAPRTASDYEVQATVYRDAASALSGRTPRVLLHFTHPDVAVEM